MAQRKLPDNQLLDDAPSGRLHQERTFFHSGPLSARLGLPRFLAGHSRLGKARAAIHEHDVRAACMPGALRRRLLGAA